MMWGLPVKPETTTIIVVFLVLLILETIRPLRRPKRGKGKRFLVNLLIIALSFVVGLAVVRPLALGGGRLGRDPYLRLSAMVWVAFLGSGSPGFFVDGLYLLLVA
jgi:hypothetical protein